MTRRSFSKELKLQIITEIRSGKKVSQIAKEYQISRTLIHQWIKQYDKYGNDAFAGNGNAYTLEAKIAELERKVGQLTMENDLLKKANLFVKENHQKTRLGGRN